MSVPSAPVIEIRPRASDGALEFYWSAPLSDGGSPITGYTLSASGVTTQNLSSSTYYYNYTGLTNGTSYTFSLTAENANGSSPAAVFRTVQPGNTPGAVQNLTASRGQAPKIALDWDAPSSDGGATIGWYTVTATNTDYEQPVIEQSIDGSTTAATIGGLTTDSVYNYTVQAVNDPGYATPVSTGLYSLTPTWNAFPINGELNFWNAVACDVSGTKILACPLINPGGPLYRSSDQGANWKEVVSGLPVTLGYNPWRRCASSDDGSVVYATSGQLIFKSSNSGATWTLVLSVATRTWTSIACSSNGSVVIVAPTSGTIYTSTDSATNWTEQSTPGSRSWTAVCCSKNGQTLIAIGTNFTPWTSADAGANWTNQTSGLSAPVNHISCSNDATKIIFTANTGLVFRSTDSGASASSVFNLNSLPTAINTIPQGSASSSDGTIIHLITANSIYRSSNSGSTWQRRLIVWNRAGTGNFTFITCSSDGSQVVVARNNGNLWLSKDSGETWRELNSPRGNFWYSFACSTDGMKQYTLEFAASSGRIWESTDAGLTWIKDTTIGTKAWRWICCSADGTKVAATESTGNAGFIWTSADSGITWTQQLGSGARNWRAIACDISGSKLVAAVATATVAGYIYTSTDSGVTWTEQTAAGQRNWRGVACSADGSIIVAANSTTGFIYTSTDSGVTWNEITGPGTASWQATACSANGAIMLAAASSGGTVWRSTDTGVNWTATSLPAGTYIGVTMTPDGTKMVACDLYSNIYVSTDSGVNWTAQTKLFNQAAYGAAISSDGSKIVTGSYGGGSIWNYRLFG